MALHFVGFEDDRVHAARRVFGDPDFYHRIWDVRAHQEIAPGDRVVFANKGYDFLPEHFVYDVPPKPSWDDSRQDIIARGGEKGVDYI